MILVGIVMSQIPEKELKKRKFRLLILVGLVMMGITAGIIAAMYQSGMFATMPASQLYGRWVEQGVPTYAQDSFTINSAGIYSNGRLINTQYAFDGTTLRYVYGEAEYVYQVEDVEGNKLLRLKPTHYRSSFHKQ